MDGIVWIGHNRCLVNAIDKTFVVAVYVDSLWC